MESGKRIIILYLNMAKKSAKQGKKGAAKQQQPKPKKQQQPTQRVVVQKAVQPHGGEECRRYARSLLDPFNAGLGDVRVPDEYAFPSQTFTVKPRFTINTSAGGAFSVVLFPSMQQPATIFEGSLGTGSVGAIGIAAQLSSYRIVSWGARIRLMLNQAQVQGEVAYACTPSSHYVILNSPTIGGQVASGTAASNLSNQAQLMVTGLPWVGTGAAAKPDFSALGSMPWSDVRSTANLYNKMIEFHGKVSSPQAFQFRQSKDQYAGFDTISQTSSAYITSGDANYLSAHGWNDICIAGTGFPASVAAVEVQMVYHVEGTPQVGQTGTAGVQVVADIRQATLSDPLAWYEALRKAADSPWVKVATDVGKTVMAML